MDEFGSVITQAKVTFIAQSGRLIETLTNQEGVFKADLHAGKYTIEFRKVGFSTYRLENYKVARESTMHIDVALEVGVIIDTIPTKGKKRRTR